MHGDPPHVARGIRAHLDAGADHVQIQLVSENSAPHPQMPDVLLQVYDDAAFGIYERLAGALGITPERTVTEHALHKGGPCR